MAKKAEATQKEQAARSAPKLLAARDRKRQRVLHRIDGESRGGEFNRLRAQNAGSWAQTERPPGRWNAVAGRKGDADKKRWVEGRALIRKAVLRGWLWWVADEYQEPVGVDSGHCDMGTEEGGTGSTVDSVDATVQRSCVVDEGGEACAGRRQRVRRE